MCPDSKEINYCYDLAAAMTAIKTGISHHAVSQHHKAILLHVRTTVGFGFVAFWGYFSVT